MCIRDRCVCVCVVRLTVTFKNYKSKLTDFLCKKYEQREPNEITTEHDIVEVESIKEKK